MNNKIIMFFFLFIIFLFVFSIPFPLLSQAGPHPSPQSESSNSTSYSNSLKTSSSSKSEASSLFEEALEAMEKKDFKKAKQNFEKLIFNYPQNPETSICCFYLGGIYQKEDLIYEAQAIYNQFVQQYPNHQLLPEILFRQAEIHFQLGEMSKAQKVFKQLLFKYPETNLASKATFRLGDCLFESDNLARARLYYYEGIKKLPEYINNHPQTALNIGCFYLEDRQFDQALQIFSNIEKNFSKTQFSNKAATFYGDVYMEQGEIQEALQTYQRVIESYPKSIGAQISKIRMANLGIEHRETEIKDPNHRFQAFHNPISAYQELMQKKTLNLDLTHLVEYKLGTALQKEKKYAEAIAVFRSVLKKNPELRIYQNCLHSLRQVLIKRLTQYFHKKEYFKVIKIYEKNKHLLDPYLNESKNPTPYFIVGRSYQNLDFYSSALHLYEKSEKINVALCPGNKICDQIRLHLGQIFYQTKEYQKALDSIQKINIKSDPTLTSDVLSLKGDIYYEQGNFSKAIEIYLAALKSRPAQRDPEYLFKISQCYQKLTNTSEAIKFLNKAADSAQKKEDTPKLVKIYLNLANCLYNVKNYSRALKTYQKLETLPLAPEDKDWVLFQIGNCSQKKTNIKEALHTFEKLKTSTQDPIWSIIADFKNFEIRQIP